jgi:phage terminase large subunit GpA-like protein
MDAFCDPKNEQIVVMSSAQVGKSSMIENIIGYYASQDPSPIMLMQPTLEMAEAFSKDRIAPMIRDTPMLSAAFGNLKNHIARETILHKPFPGGHLTLVGANSPASLASRPVRVLLADEVDRFPLSAGSEGDPLNLGIKRTSTFFNRRIGVFSTPTIKNISRIEDAFSTSDQRRYFVPCPFCRHYQVLSWPRLRWEKTESGEIAKRTTWYECEHCAEKIPHDKKFWMLERGEWRPTAEFSGIAGFHLNELYSPWRRWIDIAEDFLRAKKSPSTLRVWVNTSLGETWEEEGDTIEATDVLSRREFYGDGDCPDQVLALTAGLDVQIDRIELVVAGWGLDEECWLIDHQSFFGPPDHAETWIQVDEYLQKDFVRNDGLIMQISAACLDTGAFTQSIYDYISSSPNHRQKRLFAVKGMAGNGKPICSKGAWRKSSAGRHVQLYLVGGDEAKLKIMHGLQTPVPGPHYIHLPLAWWCDDEFVAQLTAEQLFRKTKNGQPYYQWAKRRDRNEALDCLVYALAALYIAFNGHHLRVFRDMVSGAQPKKVSRGTRSKGLQ